MRYGKNEILTEILKRLKKQYPNTKCALNFASPLEILIATILSTQCTDKRVNIVTEKLFKKYKSAKDYADVDIRELEQDIRSTGFYRNKSKSIKNSCKMIVEQFNGKVPNTMAELLELPGVARKTANIVLGNAYGIIEGIAVDTHVRRLSQRLDLTKNNEPNKIEQDLMRIVPKNEWFNFNYLIVEHGRAVCKAPTPICSKCVLSDLCLKVGVKRSY